MLIALPQRVKLLMEHVDPKALAYRTLKVDPNRPIPWHEKLDPRRNVERNEIVLPQAQ